MRYKSYTRVSRSTYMHKIQPLRIRPIGPIASESVAVQKIPNSKCTIYFKGPNAKCTQMASSFGYWFRALMILTLLKNPEELGWDGGFDSSLSGLLIPAQIQNKVVMNPHNSKIMKIKVWILTKLAKTPFSKEIYFDIFNYLCCCRPKII